MKKHKELITVLITMSVLFVSCFVTYAVIDFYIGTVISFIIAGLSAHGLNKWIEYSF